MGNCNHGTGVLGQVLLQPEDTLSIEVVGGLVQEEKIGLLEKQLTQRYTTLLTSRKVGNGSVGRWASQRIHCLLELRVKIPCICGINGFLKSAHFREKRIKICVRVRHCGRNLIESNDLVVNLPNTIADVFKDGLGFIEFRFLQQNSHGIPRGQGRVTVRRGIEPRHNLENGRLTRTIGAHHADLRPGEEGHGDIVQNELVAHRFTCADHCVNEFSHRFLVYGLWLPGLGD